MLKCLRDNEGKLSAPCRSAVTNQSAADCRPDAKRLCSTVTSGGSAVVECAARLDSMAKQN